MLKKIFKLLTKKKIIKNNKMGNNAYKLLDFKLSSNTCIIFLAT